jgi:hypothetical protein
MNRIEKALLFLAGAAVWGEILMYVVIALVGLFGTTGLVLVLSTALCFAWWVSQDSRSEGRAAFGGLALSLFAAVTLSIGEPPQDLSEIVVPIGTFICGHFLFSFAIYSRLYGFGRPATVH